MQENNEPPPVGKAVLIAQDQFFYDPKQLVVKTN
jgi:hypothetical protein